MTAHRVEVKLPPNRQITLKDLPFVPGADLEIILLEKPQGALSVRQNPLWGTAVEYKDPFEPVAVDDWEALK